MDTILDTLSKFPSLTLPGGKGTPFAREIFHENNYRENIPFTYARIGWDKTRIINEQNNNKHKTSISRSSRNI